MTELIGPDSALVNYRPVVQIADSKKNDDAVTLKTAGAFGPSEFSIEEIATIWEYLGDFLTLKGLNPHAEAKTASILRLANADAD